MSDELLVQHWVNGFKQGVRMNGKAKATRILAQQAAICQPAATAWDLLARMGKVPAEPPFTCPMNT